MITNIASFQMDLKRFYEVVTPQNHLNLQKRIVIRLHQLIVVKNSQMKNHPVDTGWARANWGLYLGTPSNTIIGSYPGKGVRANLPIFNLASVLAQAKPFGIMWICNNVPYIVRLENGHSTQAPAGIVEGALNDLQTFINSL